MSPPGWKRPHIVLGSPGLLLVYGMFLTAEPRHNFRQLPAAHETMSSARKTNRWTPDSVARVASLQITGARLAEYDVTGGSAVFTEVALRGVAGEVYDVSFSGSTAYRELIPVSTVRQTGRTVPTPVHTGPALEQGLKRDVEWLAGKIVYPLGLFGCLSSATVCTHGAMRMPLASCTHSN